MVKMQKTVSKSKRKKGHLYRHTQKTRRLKRQIRRKFKSKQRRR